MSGLIRQIITKLNHLPKYNFQNNLKITPNGLLQKNFSTAPTPYEIIDPKENKKLAHEIIEKVNNQVSNSRQGRLFAVVYLAGKQFKITENDLIIIEGYWPPDTGDKISLDKIMLLGSTDFTLIGRPLIQRGLAKIEATIIEKSLSHTKTHFKKYRRKQYMRINFYRIPQTMLRINKIDIIGELNNTPDVTGLETRIF